MMLNMWQIIQSFLKKLFFRQMVKKYKLGFTLVELVIASLIVVSITGSIMYGIITTDNSIRNVELREKAFVSLSNKMEELKAQVALNRIQSPSVANQRTCIEYKSISDMINRRENAGCQTVGYFSHNIRNRKNQSLNTQLYDIEASIKYKMISRFGIFYTDTVIKLNVTQLVLN